MPRITKQLLLPYPAQAMFDLVDKVEDYPSFLPWCSGTKVQRESQSKLSAEVLIDFKGLKTSFTTDNQQTRPSLIQLKLQKGPFASLQGSWQFKALAQDACKVNFELDYEFAGWMLSMAVAPVFDQIAKTFVDAFVHEAARRFDV